MRIWHTFLAVWLVAMLLTIGRDPAGRVAIVVFVGMAAELICGLGAVMMLFQAVGSIGEAKGPLEQIQGVVATSVILVVGATLMVGVLALSVLLVSRIA